LTLSFWVRQRSFYLRVQKEPPSPLRLGAEDASTAAGGKAAAGSLPLRDRSATEGVEASQIEGGCHGPLGYTRTRRIRGSGKKKKKKEEQKKNTEAEEERGGDKIVSPPLSGSPVKGAPASSP
jgi:hypothetical protein